MAIVLGLRRYVDRSKNIKRERRHETCKIKKCMSWKSLFQVCKNKMARLQNFKLLDRQKLNGEAAEL